MSAKGQSLTGYELTHKNMGFKGGVIPDKKELKDNQQFFNDWIIDNYSKKKYKPIRTSIGDRITVGDICVRGYKDLKYKKIGFTKAELESQEYISSEEFKAGDTFKWSDDYRDWLLHHHDQGGLFDFGSNKDFSKEYEKYQVRWPSSMDGFSYLLAMNHNVELHIRAIQDACKAQDQPIEIAKNHVTSDLLEWKDLSDEIFSSEKPMELITKHKKMLENITGMNATHDIAMEIF
jgi:hypothetical protein